MWVDHNVVSFKSYFEKCWNVSGQIKRDPECGFIVLHPLKLSSKRYRAMWNGTSPQRPLPTTATSLQRPPRCNGHLSTTTTPLQRPPFYNCHLCTKAISLQWPPLYNGHLSMLYIFFFFWNLNGRRTRIFSRLLELLHFWYFMISEEYLMKIFHCFLLAIHVQKKLEWIWRYQ